MTNNVGFNVVVVVVVGIAVVVVIIIVVVAFVVVVVAFVVVPISTLVTPNDPCHNESILKRSESETLSVPLKLLLGQPRDITEK